MHHKIHHKYYKVLNYIICQCVTRKHVGKVIIIIIIMLEYFKVLRCQEMLEVSIAHRIITMVYLEKYNIVKVLKKMQLIYQYTCKLAYSGPHSRFKLNKSLF